MSETRNGRSGMGRRELLARAAGAGLALPAIVPGRVLGAGAPSRQVALAHIGVGGRGGDLMSGFLGLPECRVVAVSDCFRSRREAAARRADERYGGRGCRMYADFRELCADPGIDAVVVATPDHWHVLAALEAVRCGKHVYVEKPLGISVEQDHALRDAVLRSGAVFQYGTQQRSQGHMRWACEMVMNGRLGRLKAIEVVSPGGVQGGSTEPAPVPADLDYDRLLGPAPEAPYTVDRCTSSGSYHISDFALGFIAGWGAHPLDIMTWALGDGPESVPVEFEGSGVFPSSGLFDTALAWDVRGRFADGKTFRFTGPGGDLTTFIGERGVIGVSRGGFVRIEPTSLRDEKPGPGDRRLRASDNHGANFIEAVKRGGGTVSTIAGAVASDTVSHLSDIAIRTARRIRWDTAHETISGDAAAARMLRRPMRAPWRIG